MFPIRTAGSNDPGRTVGPTESAGINRHVVGDERAWPLITASAATQFLDTLQHRMPFPIRAQVAVSQTQSEALPKLRKLIMVGAASAGIRSFSEVLGLGDASPACDQDEVRPQQCSCFAVHFGHHGVSRGGDADVGAESAQRFSDGEARRLR
jgi:hypothetical protein